MNDYEAHIPDTTLIGGVTGLRRNWAWLLVIGILLILLGIVALADAMVATVISMSILGGVLVAAGIVEAVQAARHRMHQGHLFLHTLNAVLAIVIGAMLMFRPLSMALLITFLLAVYFTVAGVFRIVAALALRVPHWGWPLFDGIVTLILGILIWAHWPISSLWIVGVFLGISLIFAGWSQVMLAATLRRLPA